MKTTLPERSLVIKPLLDQAICEILKRNKNIITKIILFGSYARGDWIQEEYIEKNITYSYQNDIGIMVIFKKESYVNQVSSGIEARLKSKLMFNSFSKNQYIGLIFASINMFNKELRRGNDFYTNLKKEGILLYDSGEFAFDETKGLPSRDKRRETVQKDFQTYYWKGAEFLIDALNAFHKSSYNQGAFYLHQTAENFYNVIIFISLGYRPKLHNLRKLGSIAGNYHQELLQVFPYSSVDKLEMFKLLSIAYVESRYHEDYQISREQLLYLIERVNYLQSITKRICGEYMGQFVNN